MGNAELSLDAWNAHDSALFAFDHRREAGLWEGHRAEIIDQHHLDVDVQRGGQAVRPDAYAAVIDENVYLSMDFQNFLGLILERVDVR